jgi:RHH-type rel operon transcriptional repressor/antitoxin RelB
MVTGLATTSPCIAFEQFTPPEPSSSPSTGRLTARLRDTFGAELDAAAQQLNRCRADIIRQAIEYYLDDIEDLRCGVAALKDPADPVLDWAEVRDALLAAGGSLPRGLRMAAQRTGDPRGACRPSP